MRKRLKDILRQYELRERHFECVIRSKELEVLLSRARAAEQKQLAEGEKARAEKVEEEVRRQFLIVITPPLERPRNGGGSVYRTNNFERSWTMRRRVRRCSWSG